MEQNQHNPKHPYELFGIECNKGWSKLYQPLIEVCKQNNIAILQIKEKFGGLRFYIAGTPEGLDWIQDLIDIVEEQSFYTCEDCGIVKGVYKNGKESIVTTTGKGWILTLCEDCRRNNEKTK